MREFTDEHGLPKLPLASLERTFAELEECIKPLWFADGYYKHPLDPEHAYDLSGKITDFLKSSVSTKLQRKLEEFYGSKKCYFDGLHLDIDGYLGTDGHHDVLPRNPFLVLAEDAVPDISQAERAGILCYSAVRFASALKRGLLAPDMGSGGRRLSMSAYSNLFGSTRCPVFREGEIDAFDLNRAYHENDLDDYDCGPREAWFSNDDEPARCNGITMRTAPDSKHVLIISRGQYYTLEVLDQDNDLIYNELGLADALKSILEDSSKPQNAPQITALGSLTSYSMKTWRYARKRLQKRFPEEMKTIDTALFVLVLDESVGAGLGFSECKRLFNGTSVIDENTGFQTGSCISRWYDKLQVIVTADAKAAVVWDSYTCDGSAVLRFTSDMYAESILRLAREVNGDDPNFSLWPSVSMRAGDGEEFIAAANVRKIVWSFSKILKTHIHLSETNLTDLISKHDIVQVRIPYGRRAAQQYGVKADSLIQVALQVAHYALYGKMAFTWEPASTRYFQNCRSSCVPIQNQRMLELCQVFISNSLSETDKLEMFLDVCHSHTRSLDETKHGSSFEKHFAALRYLFRFHRHFGIEMEKEELKIASSLFTSEMLVPLLAPEIIAANCGNPAMLAFGINPAVSQGFGIGYIIKDDQCELTATSQFRQGNRLLFMVHSVLAEVDDYWNSNRSTSSSSATTAVPINEKLYELDNAGASGRHKGPRLVQGGSLNRGFGLFDLNEHIKSRSPSQHGSRNNSSAKLNELHRHEEFAPSHLFERLDATKEEMESTGRQILLINPEQKLSQEPSFSKLESSPRPKSNVISSRFDIDFERGLIGKKVFQTSQ
ncbi:LAMI_0G15984g1_1 [Lachancea mirantina]|uniref:LAMI_0G15984g1_1 n=1 Tax=Lachancea mirantina TaxID=1230905 RepID=A0A1G4KCV5_9SACH|nr:LAMI_0G15984g1_1 [Lachancea mirantina]